MKIGQSPWKINNNSVTMISNQDSFSEPGRG